MMSGQPSKSVAGFTLIELILVILIVAILLALGGRLIVAPVTGYTDLVRRSRLVDQADQAVRCLQADLHRALPNSIRIAGAGRYLELLHVSDGGRYRRASDPNSGGDDILDFARPDDSFEVLGALRKAPSAGSFHSATVDRGVIPGGTERKAIPSEVRARIELPGSSAKVLA